MREFWRSEGIMSHARPTFARRRRFRNPTVERGREHTQLVPELLPLAPGEHGAKVRDEADPGFRRPRDVVDIVDRRVRDNRWARRPRPMPQVGRPEVLASHER